VSLLSRRIQVAVSEIESQREIFEKLSVPIRVRSKEKFLKGFGEDSQFRIHTGGELENFTKQSAFEFQKENFELLPTSVGIKFQ
jgi:hypothetical protein